jgi:hypothetical protein
VIATAAEPAVEAIDGEMTGGRKLKEKLHVS